MFGKNVEAISNDRHSHSIVQDGMVILGTIDAKGDVRLDGRLDGKITVSERLTIGASGILNADVEAAEIVVMGQVEGSIRASRRLELRKGAKVVGDITTPTLVIEEGVHFHGNSNMQPESETTPILATLPGGAAARSQETEEEAYPQAYQ